MATPIFPPTITTNILVNTLSSRKIVYLPAVSTIGPGRLVFIKDIPFFSLRQDWTVLITDFDRQHPML
jgi:hypothetical protein